MKKLSDELLCEVVGCFNVASSFEENFFYSPDESTIIQYVCIMSRLEWMRRKLNKLGLCQELMPLDAVLDSGECEHDLESIASDELNEGDYGVGAAFMNYSFENIIMSYSKSLGWDFSTRYLNQKHFDELTEIIFREHYKGTKHLHNLDVMIDDIYEGYVMVAPEIVSRAYYFVTNSNINDMDAGKFLQYLPKWVTYYYIDNDMNCHGELIKKNYVCSSVLLASDSEIELGFESQITSLPFAMMLSNHYAIVLAEKYPEILGYTEVAAHG